MCIFFLWILFLPIFLSWLSFVSKTKDDICRSYHCLTYLLDLHKMYGSASQFSFSAVSSLNFSIYTFLLYISLIVVVVMRLKSLNKAIVIIEPCSKFSKRRGCSHRSLSRTNDIGKRELLWLLLSQFCTNLLCNYGAVSLLFSRVFNRKLKLLIISFFAIYFDDACCFIICKVSWVGLRLMF